MNTYKHAIDNLFPDNDEQRVAALRRYQVFNDEPEPVFDRICELACNMFNVSIAHISFLDEENELVKSSMGLGEQVIKVDRSISLCAITVLNGSSTVIPNALLDERLAGHPYVYGEFGLRAYAGAPILSNDGYIVGTMCLVSRVVRDFTGHEVSLLEGLARIVNEQLELRLENLEYNNQQKSIQDRLIASEARLRCILDTMADGVCIVNENGTTTYINQMAEQIFGVNLLQMQSRSYNDSLWINLRLDGSALPIDEHPMYTMLKTGAPVYDREIGVARPGKNTFYISVNAVPLFSDQNELSGGVCTFIDVTARRKLMKEKDDFISIASHELKTPITSLGASLQLMKKMKDNLASPILPKLIEQANKSMERLNSLVGSLLDVNNINIGALRLNKKAFIIYEMIDECCQQLRLAGEYRLKITGDCSLRMYADQERISQVVVNLINNAVKYAPESRVIKINISIQDGMAKISVEDQGRGIDIEKIPHLFDRYYRADYKSLHYSGLGLGLYISADIIRRHGGEIGVDSVPGQGACFWFTAPLSDQ
ncbi:ATP-binding protein [Pedobacter sp. WC2501]|uniref:ATP-binding protein n=1 Tax=Pedobacter sp. WC2501 TaxID=3461400 RepID=UPI004046052A